jgi:outer membrane protein assembly factor BamB
MLMALAASPALAADWPQWGGGPSRNMASGERGLPAEFHPPKSENEPGLRLKWTAKVGSQVYGNPTVAGGRVYLGTNNDTPRDPKHEGDRGVVMCLNEADGNLLWQLVVPKLPAGAVVDADDVGVCSSPAVEGDRIYLVTNRCEVVCLDAKGLANGNDGPFQDEAKYAAGPGESPVELGPTDADILWRFNMYDETGVFPHQMASSNVLIVGDRLYVTTSNGVDWTRTHLPNPDAPALICLDKNTGKLLGEERSGISRRTFKCNWSSPAYGEFNGKGQVIFGGDDGFCYGFDPVPTADGTLKELWRYDCNAPAYRAASDGKPMKYGTSKGPSGVLATPVVANDRVYIAIGQDPENSDGVGRLNCIDPTKTGDISKTGQVWTFDQIGRSMSTVSVADGLLYVADFAGRIYCLDADTGKLNWTHDGQSALWGSTFVADGKVYVGNEDRFIFTFAAGREKKLLAENEFPSPIYSTPVAANGVLYIATSDNLYAFSESAKP